MQPALQQATVQASPSPAKLALVFVTLFLAYQAGEGLAIRVLHSEALLIGLRLAFLPLAWLCGRALGFRGLDAWYMALAPGWGMLLAACFVLAILAKAGALAVGATWDVYQVDVIGTIGRPLLQPLPVGGHWLALGWNFAGQFADRVVVVEVPVPGQGVLMSVVAHLVMLAVVALVAHKLAAPAASLQN